jgi:hypothetical protein
MVKISVNDGIEILARGQPITDSNGVGEVINSSNLDMVKAALKNIIQSLILPLKFRCNRSCKQKMQWKWTALQLIKKNEFAMTPTLEPILLAIING